MLDNSVIKFLSDTFVCHQFVWAKSDSTLFSLLSFRFHKNQWWKNLKVHLHRFSCFLCAYVSVCGFFSCPPVVFCVVGYFYLLSYWLGCGEIGELLINRLVFLFPRCQGWL